MIGSVSHETQVLCQALTDRLECPVNDDLGIIRGDLAVERSETRRPKDEADQGIDDACDSNPSSGAYEREKIFDEQSASDGSQSASEQSEASQITDAGAKSLGTENLGAEIPEAIDPGANDPGANNAAISNSTSGKKDPAELSSVEVDRVIQMAWEDRTPFDAIQDQFGIVPGDVIKLMRRKMKPGSFKLWRRRTTGRKTKHVAKRGYRFGRFRCPSQKG